MISKILVPTDGSRAARKAAMYAVDLAKQLEASVIALSVIDRRSFTGQTVPAGETARHVIETIEDYLREAAEGIRSAAIKSGIMKRLKAWQLYLLFILILSLFSITGCRGGDGTGQLGSSADSAPTVTAVAPLNRATGVAINSNITATFSEAMDAATINTSTFTLACPAGTPVTGVVTYVAASRMATFNPTGNLAVNTICAATITTGVKDTAGNPLASNFVWTFTTGVTADTTAPRVIATVNANGATGVPTNTRIGATFSEAMDPTTITATNFTFTTGGVPVPGTVTYSGVDLVFTPTSILVANTLYTATITTGATDLAGNALAANYVWSWTTGGVSDTTAPTITSKNPADGSIGICINKSVNTTFSEAMDPTKFTSGTFMVKNPALSLVAGLYSYNATTFVATFTPTSNLAINTTYTVTMTTGVEDIAGNPLAANNVWTFTTGTSTCQDTIALNSAAPFAVLASANISGGAVGTTIIGDLGIATKTLTSITGFVGGGAPATPGTVSGTIYASNAPGAGDTTSSTARSDLNTAYLAAKGRTTGVITISGNQGGVTLYPGLYHSTSSLAINGTALTLDAQGDCDAVFIIGMESTLTTTTGGDVTLAGCALPKNIFWRVGSLATLGAAIFKGTILADTTISVTTQDVTVDGRLLGSAVNDGAVIFSSHAHKVIVP